MSILRSLLFIPGDSEKKLSKADASRADAIILDLEDSITPARKAAARDIVAAFLRERPQSGRRPELWVRINPLHTPLALGDVAAITAAAPDGIVLPKAGGPEDAVTLSHYLDALEAQAGLASGSVKILPVATETPIAPFRLQDYVAAKLSRLAGLSWGAEDLGAALGASTNLDAQGEWGLTYKVVRALTLLAARASGVQAIDTLFANFRDREGLRASCRAARAEGFSGRLAIHPDQVDIINESFSPSEEEVAFARRVVAAFAASPDSGAIGLDGKMLDIPHLIQAKNVLALHEAHRA